MTIDATSSPDPARFGTDAFYAAIGRAFVAMCAAVPVLFVIELLDQLTGEHLDYLGGIRPRELAGLDGILFSPLLHAGFPHVLANSVPLILLGTFVLAAGTRRFLLSTAVIVLIGGVGTWLTGDAGYTVGASGVVFGYLGLLLARGVVERSWWNIAVGLLIALLYGWQLVGVLPTVGGHISWQGHLFGFIGGLVAAVLFRRRRPRPAAVTPPAPMSGDTLTLPTLPKLPT